MLWQIKKDFVSLFTRGNDKENYLDPIDGLRSICNLSIILVHLVIMFGVFIPPYPHIKWKEFLMSKAFAFSNIMGLALDVFFMLSAFLLTYKLLNQWNKNPPNSQLFLRKEYPISIIKRALRFWPGVVLATLILFIFSEPQYPNVSYFFEFLRYFSVWMFFQNYIDSQYWYVALGSLWSISIDMQVHIILPLLLYLFYSYRKSISIYNCLSILLLISIIRGIIVFDSIRMPASTLTYRYPSLLVVSSDEFIEWMKTNYNLTFSSDIPRNLPAKFFMDEMYFPLESRFGSFIIGAMLAIKLIESSNHNNKPKTFKKYFFFSLICFYLLTLIQGPTMPSPSDLVLTLFIACFRQLFTIGQAFILFTALCPSTHPYHSPWIKKFLSLSMWIPISRLSYLVYVIHGRIAIELIFGGLLTFLKSYSVTYAALICLPIVLFITQFISSIWFVLVEKPIERVVQSNCRTRSFSYR